MSKINGLENPNDGEVDESNCPVKSNHINESNEILSQPSDELNSCAAENNPSMTQTTNSMENNVQSNTSIEETDPDVTLVDLEIAEVLEITDEYGTADESFVEYRTNGNVIMLLLNISSPQVVVPQMLIPMINVPSTESLDSKDNLLTSTSSTDSAYCSQSMETNSNNQSQSLGESENIQEKDWTLYRPRTRGAVKRLSFSEPIVISSESESSDSEKVDCIDVAIVAKKEPLQDLPLLEQRSILSVKSTENFDAQSYVDLNSNVSEAGCSAQFISTAEKMLSVETISTNDNFDGQKSANQENLSISNELNGLACNDVEMSVANKSSAESDKEHDDQESIANITDFTHVAEQTTKINEELPVETDINEKKLEVINQSANPYTIGFSYTIPSPSPSLALVYVSSDSSISSDEEDSDNSTALIIDENGEKDYMSLDVAPTLGEGQNGTHNSKDSAAVDDGDKSEANESNGLFLSGDGGQCATQNTKVSVEILSKDEHNQVSHDFAAVIENQSEPHNPEDEAGLAVTLDDGDVRSGSSNLSDSAAMNDEDRREVNISNGLTSISKGDQCTHNANDFAVISSEEEDRSEANNSNGLALIFNGDDGDDCATPNNNLNGLEPTLQADEDRSQQPNSCATIRDERNQSDIRNSNDSVTILSDDEDQNSKQNFNDIAVISSDDADTCDKPHSMPNSTTSEIKFNEYEGIHAFNVDDKPLIKRSWSDCELFAKGKYDTTVDLRMNYVELQEMWKSKIQLEVKVCQNCQVNPSTEEKTSEKVVDLMAKENLDFTDMEDEKSGEEDNVLTSTKLKSNINVLSTEELNGTFEENENYAAQVTSRRSKNKRSSSNENDSPIPNSKRIKTETSTDSESDSCHYNHASVMEIKTHEYQFRHSSGIVKKEVKAVRKIETSTGFDADGHINRKSAAKPKNRRSDCVTKKKVNSPRQVFKKLGVLFSRFTSNLRDKRKNLRKRIFPAKPQVTTAGAFTVTQCVEKDTYESVAGFMVIPTYQDFKEELM